MILDTKVSSLKECSVKAQRVILPRLLDTIVQGMHNLALCREGEGMEWFVVDYTEGFWQIPLHPSERMFFCCKLTTDRRPKLLVFLRAVQGSMGAPLSWARLAALIMRLTHALFYPIASIRGLPWERRVSATIMMLLWEAVGFRVAYKKGQMCSSVDWDRRKPGVCQ